MQIRQIRISNRVFWAAVFLTGCAIVSRGANSRGDAPDVIQAHRFEVVDDTGKTRAVLTAGSAVSGNKTGPSLDFYQESPERRLVTLGLRNEDTPGLSLSEPISGKMIAQLQASNIGEPALLIGGIGTESDLITLRVSPIDGPHIDMDSSRNNCKLHIPTPGIYWANGH